MERHWGDAYYGELYLDSVEDLLGPRLSAMEVEEIARVLGLGPGDRVLDLACGHGRHARVLAGRVESLVGMDRSREYLRRAVRPPPPGPLPRRAGEREKAALFVRGDVRALPFREGAFDAAFSWYASLFMFDDPTNAACLAGLARVIRPGGRLLVHHANPAALAARPLDAARRTLPDGTLVEETSSFDARTGVDRCTRRLVRPSGAALAGTAELRYYTLSEWGPLSRSAGLRITDATETPHDLAVLLEKPT